MAAKMLKRQLLDFSDRTFGRDWRQVNDSLNGGGSECKLKTTPRGSCIFEGHVYLKNGKGYAILQSDPGHYNLGGCQGLTVRLRGDGKVYTIGLKDNDDFGGLEYRAHVKTLDGARMEVQIPFGECEVVEFDMPVDDPRPLRADRIRQVSLMVLGNQEGGFRVDIEEVAGYAEVEEETPAAQELFRS
jgi:NADH dehydrogenase [ubiquinone] 1 alpha subcomplex assembly factor 1